MIVHTTNAPLYVIVINLLTEAFFYTVILYLGLFSLSLLSCRVVFVRIPPSIV